MFFLTEHMSEMLRPAGNVPWLWSHPQACLDICTHLEMGGSCNDQISSVSALGREQEPPHLVNLFDRILQAQPLSLVWVSAVGVCRAAGREVLEDRKEPPGESVMACHSGHAQPAPSRELSPGAGAMWAPGEQPGLTPLLWGHSVCRAFC